MSDEYIYEQTKQQSTKVLGEREEVWQWEWATDKEINNMNGTYLCSASPALMFFEIWFYVVYARMALGLFFEKFMVLQEYTTGTVTLVLTIRLAQWLPVWYVLGVAYQCN
jgi:hypothetical protein